jgi:hypothetical protein
LCRLFYAEIDHSVLINVFRHPGDCLRDARDYQQGKDKELSWHGFIIV